MAIPKECKRLIEVDFPIAVVSKHSAREKSIRHGHPSTLHLWWARRPLAACRAVLMGLLLPDPCDENCPKEFKESAREILIKFPQRPSGWAKEIKTDIGLRQIFLKFIGDFANWDVSSDPDYIETARGLVKAAHPEETPLVVDPFAGGGSIPLEALRLGCDAFASDLNPVACLILKVMLEDIPRHGPKLAEELRKVGKEIKEAAEKELKEFYPDDPDGSKPIAYLWARTVKCEAPNCGAEIPLMRSFWLCKKTNRKRALKAKFKRQKERDKSPEIEFEIFEPLLEKEVHEGTVSHAKAKCMACGSVLPPDRVRAQLASQCGGADVIFDGNGNRTGGAKLLAIVTLTPGESGRHYRLPNDKDYKSVWKAHKQLDEISKKKLPGGLSPIPDEPTPVGGGSGAGRAFSIQKYGMKQWANLFSCRQKLSLSTLNRNIYGEKKLNVGLMLALGKLVDLSNAVCPWEPKAECARNVLSNGRISPAWGFAEGVPISDSSASFIVCLDNLSKGLMSIGPIEPNAEMQLNPAQKSPLPDQTASIWFTDPPYYDAIPYSDLSDFFFVWLKRAALDNPLMCDPFDKQNPLTPKNDETIWDETRNSNGRPKDPQFFEDSMAQAFAEAKRIISEKGISCVVFAHKTTEGWEALLSGMIKGGWVITGSWPIATEQAHRLRARDSAALATSVHLICRPRPDDAEIGDWGYVLSELPGRVGDWMERLQGEGIRGADLVFACIGPALEIFSRYSKVETAEGREVKLAEYLEKVWEVVGRTALEHVLGTAEARARNGVAGALEEDARLTALFLWTLQATNGQDNGKNANGTDEEIEDGNEGVEDDEESPKKKKPGGYSLIYDVARRFAQPLGIHLEEWEDRIIKTEKGVVRLLPIKERANQLFGEKGANAFADEMEDARKRNLQLKLFLGSENGAVPDIKGRARGKGRKKAADVSDESLRTRMEATTLDRVHAAMLLQAGGRTNALRALLKSEQERSPDFLRLANALSALYPKASEEKRLLDAMILATPR